MNVSVARYLLGAGASVLVLGSLSWAAVLLRKLYFTGATGALARLVEALVALGLLIAILELLGTVGLFSLAPVVLASAVSAIGVAALARRRPLRAPTASAVPPSRLRKGAPALLASAAVGVVWAAPTLFSYDVGIRTFDSMWYHLPWAASFAQSGHITPLRFTDVEYLTAFYPANSELFHGLGIVLLARDTFSPALNLLWLTLALLAGWCIGRPRGVGIWSLIGVAIAMATPMMIYSQGGSAANDAMGVFFLLAAVALLSHVWASKGTTPAAWQILAGVCAGLAVAVKLSLLGPVLALTIGWLAIAPERPRLRAWVRWVGPLVLASGFWYLRNLIAVGNPLPWTSLGVLPTPAAPLQQHTGFSVFHYLGSSRFWQHFFGSALAVNLGPWWYLVLALVLLGALLCLLPGAGAFTRMLGLVSLASGIAYLATPESAAGPAGDPVGFAFNMRYAAPAIALSLAIMPLAPVVAAAIKRRAVLAVPALLLVAMVVHGASLFSRHVAGALLITAVVVGAGLVAAWLRGLWLRHPSDTRIRRPALGLMLASALILGACALGGYVWQRHYLRNRYAFAPGFSELARVWARFRQIHHARVAVVGTYGGFFSYPLYGLDDSNRVRYVARRGRHGSFTPITTCAGWRAALNTGHFRYVVTTPGRDPWRARVLTFSPEGGWTASDPAAHTIFSRHVLGAPIAVYELHGLLNPAACRQRTPH